VQFKSQLQVTKQTNIVGVGHPNLNFWGIQTHTTPTVAAHRIIAQVDKLFFEFWFNRSCALCEIEIVQLMKMFPSIGVRRCGGSKEENASYRIWARPQPVQTAVIKR